MGILSAFLLVVFALTHTRANPSFAAIADFKNRYRRADRSRSVEKLDLKEMLDCVESWTLFPVWIVAQISTHRVVRPCCYDLLGGHVEIFFGFRRDRSIGIGSKLTDKNCRFAVLASYKKCRVEEAFSVANALGESFRMLVMHTSREIGNRVSCQPQICIRPISEVSWLRTGLPTNVLEVDVARKHSRNRKGTVVHPHDFTSIPKRSFSTNFALGIDQTVGSKNDPMFLRVNYRNQQGAVRGASAQCYQNPAYMRRNDQSWASLTRHAEDIAQHDVDVSYDGKKWFHLFGDYCLEDSEPFSQEIMRQCAE